MALRKIPDPKNTVAKDLVKQHARPQKPGAPALSASEISKRVAGLAGWILEGGRIRKTYKFGDYFETIEFVNVIAWLSNREDHHPDLEVGYDKCIVHYSTHSVGGLSENDFICAAKLDKLMRA